jgi:hypothetical protein
MIVDGLLHLLIASKELLEALQAFNGKGCREALGTYTTSLGTFTTLFRDIYYAIKDKFYVIKDRLF